MAAKRQPVAKGGLWSTQAAPVSKETQNLLKVMMEESKLTNFQRRQLNEKLSSGQPLPTTVNPTSSRTQQPRKHSPVQKPLPMVLNARHLSGGKRNKEVIDQLQDEQPKEDYKPSPGKLITDSDKRKLQNVMAFGEYGKKMEVNPKIKSKNKKQSIPKKEVDRFDEVLQEIEERKQFLEEMEAAGKGDQYKTIINTEISQKIRELEVIDQKRSKELDSLLQEDQS
ncbi:UPF0193 protein EVG1 homolog [Actinia tenebrosa]|uniref:UPF0193 protein EVG1 homolog n=1 Tax=Actinia tenebrosa TaxID=6105 RepID=A0A6P8J0N9_ACTTE|nr:UPF0193 protein EVG1 homolog [Actinia tenebrosa]